MATAAPSTGQPAAPAANPGVPASTGATPVVTATPTIDHGQSVPSTVGSAFANGQQGAATIGSYTNTGVNGYQNTPGIPQLPPAAQAAQAKNGALYNQQQAALNQPANGTGNNVVNFNAAQGSFGTPQTTPPAATQTPPATAPKGAADFAKMNAGATTVGQAAAQGQTDQKVIGTYQQPGSGTTNPTTDLNGNPMNQGLTSPVNPTAGAQNTAGQDFSKQMGDFMSSFKGDMGEFLNNQNNMYTSIMGDMRTMMQGQTAEIQAMTAEHVAALDGYAKVFQAERDAGIAQANASAETMTKFADIDKDMQLKQNEIAQQQSHAQYGDQINMATENQSRYLGYLTSKFDAAGMANSSAGMQAIGKMLAAGQMSINALARDDTNAQMMFVSKGTQISNDFFKQAFQIESQRQTATAQIRNDTNKQLMGIENDKFASEEKKLTDTYALVKDYNAAKVDIMSKSFSDVMAVKDNALKEAQFAHGVIQDSVHNQQWTQQFDQSAKQFGMTYALQERQENRAYDSQQTQATGNLWLNGQDTGTRALAGKSFDQQVAQFGQTMAYQYAGLNQAHSQFEQSFAQSGSQFQQSLAQSADQFNKSYGLNLSTQAFTQKDALLKNLQALPNAMFDPNIQKAIHDVSNNMAAGLFPTPDQGVPANLKNSKYNPTIGADGSVHFNIATGANGGECGRLVNDATGKPSFMTDSYAEKLLNAPNKIPEAGGAFVQEISGKGAKNGHTGMVEKVYGDPAHPTGMDIVDSNYSNNDDNIVRRAHVDISYGLQGQPIYTRNGHQVAIQGFTNGIAPSSPPQGGRMQQQAPMNTAPFQDIGNIAQQAWGNLTGNQSMVQGAQSQLNTPPQTYQAPQQDSYPGGRQGYQNTQEQPLGIGQIGSPSTINSPLEGLSQNSQMLLSSYTPAQMVNAKETALSVLNGQLAPKDIGPVRGAGVPNFQSAVEQLIKDQVPDFNFNAANNNYETQATQAKLQGGDYATLKKNIGFLDNQQSILTNASAAYGNGRNALMLQNGLQLAADQQRQNPQAASYIAAINDYKDAVSKLIGTGGGTDATLRQASETINPNMSHKALLAVMKTIDATSAAKLKSFDSTNVNLSPVTKNEDLLPAGSSHRTKAASTQSFTVGGTTYNIPSDQVAAFKKDMNIQ